MRAFSLVVASGSYPVLAVSGLLIVVSALAAEHRLNSGAITGLVALRCAGSSRMRGQTRVSCIGPWEFPGKNTGVGCHFLF